MACTYLVVTADQFELPIAEFDNRKALINYFGIPIQTLKEALYAGRTAKLGRERVKIIRMEEG